MAKTEAEFKPLLRKTSTSLRKAIQVTLPRLETGKTKQQQEEKVLDEETPGGTYYQSSNQKEGVIDVTGLEPAIADSYSSGKPQAQQLDVIADSLVIQFVVQVVTVLAPVGANMMAIGYEVDGLTTALVVGLVSASGQVLFWERRSRVLWKLCRYHLLVTVRYALPAALYTLTDHIIDPVATAVGRIDQLVNDFAPVKKEAQRLQYLLKRDIPDPMYVRKPLKKFLAPLTTKMDFIKQDILKAFTEFVPAVASTHSSFKFWIVQVPTLLIILLNLTSSLVVFYMLPSHPPETTDDYSIYTLQPSLVALATFAVVFLFTVLTTQRVVLNTVVNRFVSRTEFNVNKKVDEEISDLLCRAAISGFQVAKENAGNFFVEVVDLVEELKTVEARDEKLREAAEKAAETIARSRKSPHKTPFKFLYSSLP